MRRSNDEKGEVDVIGRLKRALEERRGQKRNVNSVCNYHYLTLLDGVSEEEMAPDHRRHPDCSELFGTITCWYQSYGNMNLIAALCPFLHSKALPHGVPSSTLYSIALIIIFISLERPLKHSGSQKNTAGSTFRSTPRGNHRCVLITRDL